MCVCVHLLCLLLFLCLSALCGLDFSESWRRAVIRSRPPVAIIPAHLPQQGGACSPPPGLDSLIHFLFNTTSDDVGERRLQETQTERVCVRTCVCMYLALQSCWDDHICV